MNLTAIRNVVTSKIGRQVLLTQKHSPTILFAGGVVGVVSTVVLASRATLKLEEVVKAAAEDIDTAKSLGASNHPAYSEKDMKRDCLIVYTRSAISIAKLYAPAVIVGTLSIAALTGSHIILNRRNIALTAAYNTAVKSFEQYRQRVRDELGEEKDREFRFGTEEHEVYTEDKNGKPKVEKVKRAGGTSMYAKFWDKSSSVFSDDPSYNVVTLRAQQKWANQKLKSQGYLMLNDVLDSLDIDRVPEGQLVGWLSDGEGDGYVSFGVLDGERPDEFIDFMTGRENSILLDFNVDGVVFEQIGKPRGVR